MSIRQNDLDPIFIQLVTWMYLCMSQMRGVLQKIILQIQFYKVSRWHEFVCLWFANIHLLSKMNSGVKKNKTKQEEVTSSAGQVEPPGMHMIYLPYSDDIRYPEEVRTGILLYFTVHHKISILPILPWFTGSCDFWWCTTCNGWTNQESIKSIETHWSEEFLCVPIC